MDKFSGMSFPAASIEHEFAIFLHETVGARGKHWDADFFRAGDIKQIGAALEQVAKKLDTRVASITFSAEESKNGGSKTRIDSAIKSLRGVAIEMRQSSVNEPDDYHWMIIANLLLAIDSLLTHFGA